MSLPLAMKLKLLVRPLSNRFLSITGFTKVTKVGSLCKLELPKKCWCQKIVAAGYQTRRNCFPLAAGLLGLDCASCWICLKRRSLRVRCASILVLILRSNRFPRVRGTARAPTTPGLPNWKLQLQVCCPDLKPHQW